MLAIWAGSLYLWPFGPCLRCKGSGRCQRIGAKTIHRGTVSLADKAREMRPRFEVSHKPAIEPRRELDEPEVQCQLHLHTPGQYADILQHYSQE
jgi:hypothetical protein